MLKVDLTYEIQMFVNTGMTVLEATYMLLCWFCFTVFSFLVAVWDVTTETYFVVDVEHV